jgi:hypothetical protein
MRNIQHAQDALESGNRKVAWEIIEEILLYNPDHIEALELRLEMALTDQAREEAEHRLREARRKVAPNIATPRIASPDTAVAVDVSPIIRDYLAPALITLFVYIFGSALAGLAVNAYFLDQASRDRKSGIQIEHYGCLQWLLGAGIIFLIVALGIAVYGFSNR